VTVKPKSRWLEAHEVAKGMFVVSSSEDDEYDFFAPSLLVATFDLDPSPDEERKQSEGEEKK